MPPGPTRNTGASKKNYKGNPPFADAKDGAPVKFKSKPKADSSAAAGTSSANHADDGGLGMTTLPAARRRGVNQLFFLLYSV